MLQKEIDYKTNFFFFLNIYKICTYEVKVMLCALKTKIDEKCFKRKKNCKSFHRFTSRIRFRNLQV